MEKGVRSYVDSSTLNLPRSVESKDGNVPVQLAGLSVEVASMHCTKTQSTPPGPVQLTNLVYFTCNGLSGSVIFTYSAPACPFVDEHNVKFVVCNDVPLIVSDV